MLISKGFNLKSICRESSLLFYKACGPARSSMLQRLWNTLAACSCIPHWVSEPFSSLYLMDRAAGPTGPPHPPLDPALYQPSHLQSFHQSVSISQAQVCSLKISSTFPGCPVSGPFHSPCDAGLSFLLNHKESSLLLLCPSLLVLVTSLFIMRLNCKFYRQTYLMPQEPILNQLNQLITLWLTLMVGCFLHTANNHSHMFQLIFLPPFVDKWSIVLKIN